MPRYSLYEGVKGFLCPHPAALIASRRHPGMKRRPLAEGEEFENLCDLYDPVLEVYADHKCLSRAVAAGHLKRLKGPVVAKNPAEAVAALMPKPKAVKAPKGDS